jgi:hypothetical protein
MQDKALLDSMKTPKGSGVGEMLDEDDEERVQKKSKKDLIDAKAIQVLSIKRCFC